MATLSLLEVQPLMEEESVRILIGNLRIGVIIAAAFTLGTSPASADYVSQSVNINQSNALPDGVTYGSVLIETYNGIGPGGGGLLAGQARLTFSAIVAVNYTGTDKSFGIDEVGFNSKVAITAGQISGPGGWKLTADKNLDGFGRFSWAWSGSAKGGVRPNPVTVLISGLGTSVDPAIFLASSLANGKDQAPPQGSVMFAMRVAGFQSESTGEDGHFIGGSGEVAPPPPGGSGEVMPTPEPSSIFLGVAAAGCLFLRRCWKTRRSKRDQ